MVWFTAWPPGEEVGLSYDDAVFQQARCSEPGDGALVDSQGSVAMKRKAQPKVRAGHRIKADLSKQTPNNSYSPPLYYEDVSFKCRDCGVECVWTAEQQRLWYEQWDGSVQSTAVRCRACRQRVRREKIDQKKHMQEMALKKGSKRAG